MGGGGAKDSSAAKNQKQIRAASESYTETPQIKQHYLKILH